MFIHNSGEYEDRGRALLFADRAEEALAVFDEGARRFPGDADLGLGRALALSRLGEHERAAEALETLLARRRTPEVLRALAEARLGVGRVAEAAAAAAQAAVAQGADERDAYGLARIFYERRLYKEALPFYERAAALAPGWAEAWFGVGACLWLLRRGPAAEEALRRAAALDPADHQARQFWGCVLHDLGRRAEALAALEQVPADAKWQPAALERLIALGGWPKDAERRRALELAWGRRTDIKT